MFTVFSLINSVRRRGLVKRELEIQNLIQNHNLDLMFLVETDTCQIMEQKHTTTHTYTTHNNKKRVWYIDEISELMST